jgi:hypothetical protein
MTVADRQSKAAATRYEDCIRRCEPCGIAASNTERKGAETWIFRDPIQNIPAQSREHALTVLGSAFNKRNRNSKIIKFGFSTSEDAITWVVFSYLVRSGDLIAVLRHLGLVTNRLGTTEPTVLLWGVPISNGEAGKVIAGKLENACIEFGEKQQSFSEPDIIIDLGPDGLLFIEAKYKARNDQRPAEYEGWSRYKNAPIGWTFDEVRASGCYELARNWCLLSKIAAHRRKTLVNLAPASLFSGPDRERIVRFVDAIKTDPNAQFRTITWSDLLSGMPNPANWFSDFCRSRRGLLGEVALAPIRPF